MCFIYNLGLLLTFCCGVYLTILYTVTQKDNYKNKAIFFSKYSVYFWFFSGLVYTWKVSLYLHLNYTQNWVVLYYGFHGYILIFFQQSSISELSAFFSLFNSITFSSHLRTEWSKCLEGEAEKWKAEADEV